MPSEELARRWWVRGRRIGSVERAGKFIDDVGFALLFPAPKPIGPSLWEAVADAVVAEVEAEWTAHLGAAQAAQLRKALTSLREITDPYA